MQLKNRRALLKSPSLSIASFPNLIDESLTPSCACLYICVFSLATFCWFDFLFLQSEEAMGSGGLCVSVCLSVCPLSILLACTSPHPVHVHSRVCVTCSCVVNVSSYSHCLPLQVTSVDISLNHTLAMTMYSSIQYCKCVCVCELNMPVYRNMLT